MSTSLKAQDTRSELLPKGMHRIILTHPHSLNVKSRNPQESDDKAPVGPETSVQLNARWTPAKRSSKVDLSKPQYSRSTRHQQPLKRPAVTPRPEAMAPASRAERLA